MNRKKRTHLRGERGQAFHDALGEIVTPTFKIDIFQTGFEQLCQAIDEAIARTKAQVVLTGMEPSSHYFENLARHLQQSERLVTLINSFAVKENRDQQMMLYEKDDEIDVAAIGDLLKCGEGSPFNPPQGIYLQLQHLARVRASKVKMRTMLQNQILGHLDRIFPGLVIVGKEAKKRCKPMFATDFWQCQTMQRLIRVCPNPHELTAMSTQDLIDAFHAHGYAMGYVGSTKIIAYTQRVLLPDPDLAAFLSYASSKWKIQT